MSRLLNSTSGRITLGTGITVPAIGSAGTRFYCLFDQNDNNIHLLWNFDDQGTPLSVFHCLKYSDNSLYVGWYTAAADYRITLTAGSYTLNQNAWNTILLTWNDTTNVVELWINGVSVGTRSTLVTWNTSAVSGVIGNNVAADTANNDFRLYDFFLCSAILSGTDITNWNSNATAAAGPTAETNNTSQAATGSGTLTTIRAECFNVQGGYQYLPTPESRIVFLPTEALIVSMTAPADSLTVSLTAVIEEE